MRRLLGLCLCCAVVTMFGCFDDDDKESKADYKKYKEERIEAYNIDGVTINMWQKSDYDSYGNLLKQTAYDAAGTDGKWETDDDSIYSQMRVQTDANGDPVKGVMYSDAGTDGIWGNADDVVEETSYAYNYRCTNHVVTVQYVEKSATIVNVEMYDADGNIIKSYTASGSGTDSIWGTSDDLTSDYIVYEPQNSIWSKISKNCNAGTDKLIGTADDKMLVSSVITFDGNIPQKSVSYLNLSATTATWDLTDDLMNSYLVYKEMSGVYRTIRYEGAGTDSKWFTDDDAISPDFWYDDYTFDINGTYSKMVEYNGDTDAVENIRKFYWKGFN